MCTPGKLKRCAVESLLSPELLLVLDQGLQSSGISQVDYFFKREKRFCLLIFSVFCTPLYSDLLLLPDLSYY